MEEKILVTSELYNLKKFKNRMSFLGVILSILICILTVGKYIFWSVPYYFDEPHSQDWYRLHGETYSEFAKDYLTAYVMLSVLIGLVFIGLGTIIHAFYKNNSLTVTNKRAFGSCSKKRRVDLPLDSISAIGLGGFKGIAVTTPSGAIKFNLIKNRNEIYQVVSKLLVERQNRKYAIDTPTIVEKHSDNADELKKFKELLDIGVITQVEFDAKKKQLLGL